MSEQQRFERDLRNADLLCFSHLRWNFVFQRPQHLMSRFARDRRVFFIEEPVPGDTATMHVRVCEKTGVHIAVPALPAHLAHRRDEVVEQLISQMMRQYSVTEFIAWYYTPMAISFTSTLRPIVTVYDCMDELSLFRGAPPELIQNEKLLMSRADLVFTGGLSLFEAKRQQHSRVYAFPSSVDVSHFRQARHIEDDATDHANIAHPRIGYAGVIDERLDLNLLQQLAEMRGDWQFVMLGPVVKIDPESLPQNSNIHYLGIKNYDDLPKYFAGWDVAMLPFALNDHTRFISPTKTPEYMAAGLPSVSTPIRDVVRTYGDAGLVRIASTPEEFRQAIEESLSESANGIWRHRADQFLTALSWETTWKEMTRLISGVGTEDVVSAMHDSAMNVALNLEEAVRV